MAHSCTHTALEDLHAFARDDERTRITRHTVHARSCDALCVATMVTLDTPHAEEGV